MTTTMAYGAQRRHAMNRAIRCVALLLIAFVPSAGIAAETFFDSGTLRIHYSTQGTGEPIVLAHGRGGEISAWATAGVLENLAKDYRVIALDLRGHGKSGKPHDSKQW